MPLRDIPSLDNSGFIVTIIPVQVAATDDTGDDGFSEYLRPAPNDGSLYLRPAPNNGDDYNRPVGL